jgi:type VI secretion system protein ImpL
VAGSSVTGIVVKLGVPLALIVALLWAVNQYVSSDAARKIGSVLVLFILVLIAVWILIWIARKTFLVIPALQERRRARARSVTAAQSLSPQEQADLENLERSLDKALKVLRESKLARGRKAAEALYAVPWLLLLGPPGAGKTTALLESGVDFLYSTAPGRRRQTKKGADCDYSFGRDAVVLDLSGNVAADEEEAEVFKGFLDQLKRARKVRPIDGVLVIVSVTELEQTEEQAEALADRLRQRLDLMISRLGIRFPIYVLFTKCDLLEGFPEFFGHFRSRDRAQVWGATISREQRRQTPVAEIVGSEFDRLVESLSAYRLEALAGENDRSKLAKVYSFPARFASLHKQVEGFLAALTQPTPYAERPMFRGFYFASAAVPASQNDGPDAAGLQWDPGLRAATPEEPAPRARSYFLEALFPRVIFADRPLVTLSVDTRLRRRLWLDIVFFATLVSCAVLLVGMTFSFLRNRTLIESTQRAAQLVVDPSWNGRSVSDLTALDQLRDRVAELDRYRKTGPGWALRWGMYTGNDIADASRRVYFRRLRDTFVNPTFAAIQQKLSAFSSGTETPSGYDEFFSDLEAYLMMSEPSKSNASILTNTLSPFWKQSAPQGAEGLALQELRFYAQQLPANDPDLRLTSDVNVVAAAQLALGRYPAIDRLYLRLKEEGNRRLPAYTLAQATGGKSLEYLNSTHDVPGVFTEPGWSTFFKQAAQQANREAVQDDWVLGPAGGALPVGTDYESMLRDRYFTEYVEEWQKFLEGISVRPLTDINDARAALNSLSEPDSALSRILMGVARNTMLRKEPESGTSIASLFSNVLVSIGLSTRVNPSELVDSVTQQFQPLHDMVTSPDGKSPSLIAQYVTALGKVQIRLESLFGSGAQWDQVKAYVDTISNNLSSNEFQDAYRLTAIVDHDCTTKSTQPIGPMLEQPLRQTWVAILKDAGYHLDGLWRSQISDAFRRDLQNSFPLNPGGSDVPLATWSAYFKPHDGTLDAFYEAELKTFLTAQPDGVAPRSLMGAQVPFSASFLDFIGRINTIRQAFFPPGSPDVSLTFDLTPDSTPGVTESLLEIDGQQLRYRNESPAPYSLTWPSKSAAPQARLSIALTGTGERPTIEGIEGDWALFRLLGKATVTAQSATTYTLTWSLPGSDGLKHDVRYRLQARSFRNPFAATFFKGVVCPERVTDVTASAAGN